MSVIFNLFLSSHPSFFDDQSLEISRPSHVSPYVGIFHHPPGRLGRAQGVVKGHLFGGDQTRLKCMVILKDFPYIYIYYIYIYIGLVWVGNVMTPEF